MEMGENWGRENVISQLNQGIKLTTKLKEQLHHYSNSSDCDLLIEKIVSCYDNALALLNYMDSLSTSYVDFNPTTEVSDQDFKDHVFADAPKKRKSLARWREEVRVCSETGYEGNHEDGYNWRKYGQKDILGATHPRSYYRCTHRRTRECLATKQVQRGEDDPRILNIVYRGKHSCGVKKEKKQINDESPILQVKQLQNVAAALPLILSEPTSQSNFSMDQSSFLDSGSFALGDFDFLIDFDAPFFEVSDYLSHVQHSPLSKM